MIKVSHYLLCIFLFGTEKLLPKKLNFLGTWFPSSTLFPGMVLSYFCSLRRWAMLNAGILISVYLGTFFLHCCQFCSSFSENQKKKRPKIGLVHIVQSPLLSFSSSYMSSHIMSEYVRQTWWFLAEVLT